MIVQVVSEISAVLTLLKILESNFEEVEERVFELWREK